MNLSSVTIAGQEMECKIPYPHITYTDGYVNTEWNNLDGYRGKTLERVKYLASRRNGAVKSLLEKYPYTTHVFMIDSYYVNNTEELNNFIDDYMYYKETIMGASTWFSSYLFPYRKQQFWDTWTTPELRHLSIKTNKIISVKSVGGVWIFPVHVWNKHKFNIDKFPNGCECNSFCENSGLQVLMNTYRKFYHPNPKRYSFVKSMRVRAGYYKNKFIGKSNISEPNIIKLISKIHGELFIDIGSNKGLYYNSPIVKRNFKKIITIDPNPLWSADMKIALSNFNGNSPFYIGDNNGGADSIISNPYILGKTWINNSTYNIEVKTFDSLKLNADLAKIDVEGAEFEVLEGMKEYLPKNIIVELHDERRELELSNQLIKMGYYVSKIDDTHFLGELK